MEAYVAEDIDRMDPLSLRTLSDWSGGHLVQGNSGRTVSAVATDTRNLPEGCVYVALRGERFDGHEFLARAVANGALAVISEVSDPKLPKHVGIIFVEDTLRALQRIATEYRKTLRLTSIVTIGHAVTLDQSVPLELAQIIAELIEAVRLFGEMEGGEERPRWICFAVQPPR